LEISADGTSTVLNDASGKEEEADCKGGERGEHILTIGGWDVAMRNLMPFPISMLSILIIESQPSAAFHK